MLDLFDVRIHNERTSCDDGAGELRGRSPATHTKDQQDCRMRRPRRVGGVKFTRS